LLCGPEHIHRLAVERAAPEPLVGLAALKGELAKAELRVQQFNNGLDVPHIDRQLSGACLVLLNFAAQGRVRV
jgi:hypothetical protein